MRDFRIWGNAKVNTISMKLTVKVPMKRGDSITGFQKGKAVSLALSGKARECIIHANYKI